MVSPYLNLPTLTYALLPGESTVDISLQTADDLALWGVVVTFHLLMLFIQSRLRQHPSPDWASSRSNPRSGNGRRVNNQPAVSHRKRAAEGSDGWRVQIWWKRDS